MPTRASRSCPVLRAALACLALLGGCDGELPAELPFFDEAEPEPTTEAPAATATPAPAGRKPRPAGNDKVVPLRPVSLESTATEGSPPRGAPPLADALARIRQRAGVGEIRALGGLLSRRTVQALDPRAGGLLPIAPRTFWQRISGEPRHVRYEGARALIEVDREGQVQTLTFYLEDGAWRLDVLATRFEPIAPRAPMVPMPTLRQATAELHGTGPLVAVFRTDTGQIRCELREAQIPETIAAVVGLMRGRIELPEGTFDGGLRYYDGGRVRAQSGGSALAIVPARPLPLGVPESLERDVRFDKPGLLALWTVSPGRAEGTLLLTTKARPDLDDRATLLGRCRDGETTRKLQALGESGTTLLAVEVRRGL